VRTTREFIQKIRSKVRERYTDSELRVKSTRDIGHAERIAELSFIVGPDMGDFDPNTGVAAVLSFNYAFRRACGQVDPAKNEHLHLKRGQSFTFNTSPNVNLAKFDPICILTSSIVKPSVLSGDNKAILQAIPAMLKKQSSDNRLYEPKRLTFQKVTDFPFRSIHFQLLNPDGRMRQFYGQNATDNIHLQLLFRFSPPVMSAAAIM